MRYQLFPLLALAALAPACASTGSGPPAEASNQIIAAVDEGRTEDANRILASGEGQEFRDKVYVVLFEEAGASYDLGEHERSTRLLKFMASSWPSSRAVQEAHLKSLFLYRSHQQEPDPGVLAEIEGALAQVRSSFAVVPDWVELVSVQQAIDLGRRDEASEAFERFLDTWSGEPESLTIYVEDLHRRLNTP